MSMNASEELLADNLDGSYADFDSDAIYFETGYAETDVYLRNRILSLCCIDQLYPHDLVV